MPTKKKPGKKRAPRDKKLTEVPVRAEPERKPAATGQVEAGEPSLDHISPELRTLAVSVDQLQFHPKNVLKHSETNVARIAASLRVNGFVKNLVASTRTDPPTVVCGNGSLKAALLLGMTHVPCSRLLLTEAQENQLAIIDNVTSADPVFDLENLALATADVFTQGDAVIEEMLADLCKREGLFESEPAESPVEPESEKATCPQCGQTIK